MKKKFDLLNDDLKKLFIRYLIPSVLSSIAIAMYIFVDTMFIGLGVGSSGLAALNISLPVFTISSSLALILGIGGATTLSICVGQGKKEEGSKIFTISMLIATILGISISILGNVFSKQICLFLGASQTILPLVNEYLSILISFTWAFLIAGVLGCFIRNDKNPKLVMRATIIANISNVVLDYVFIFIFHWGMKGAVLATVISPIINILLLSIHFKSKNNTLSFKKVKVEFAIIMRIIKNGFGTFIQDVCHGVILFLFNKTLMTLGGEIYVSSYGIIVNVAYVGTCIFAGIAQSIQPIISVNFGAKKIKRVYTALKYALSTSVIVGFTLYVVVLIFPEYIISLFTTGDKELVDITIKGMRIYFLSYAFCSINMVVLYFLQSIERAKESIAISLSSGIVFSSSGLFILVYLFNILGVWFTVPFAEGITCVISIIFVMQSRKRLIVFKE